jgi:hypothetical protein
MLLAVILKATSCREKDFLQEAGNRIGQDRVYILLI